MRDIEIMSARRRILDWRDKWLLQTHTLLARDFPQLLDLLNARIERISLKSTLKSDAFVKQNVQPEFERWAETKSREILHFAARDLDLIVQNIFDYDHTANRQIVTNTSNSNIAELGVAAGSTGLALLGVPAVAGLSVNSAGWGLGLLGVTVISWPVVLGGVTVLGTMAIFGSSKLATYKNKAINQLKEAVENAIRSATLDEPSYKASSVKAVIQSHIKSSAAACIEELQRA